MEDKPDFSAVVAYLIPFSAPFLYYFKPDDEFVRFHSIQSTLLFALLGATNNILPIVAQLASGFPFFQGAILGPVLIALYLVEIGLWVYCMYKAIRGERHRLPVMGGIAQQYSPVGNPNGAAGMAYPLNLFSGFIYKNSNDGFVRFHAFQAFLLGVLLASLYAAIYVARASNAIVNVFVLIATILLYAMMRKAFSGERAVIPLLGSLADRVSKKTGSQS